MPAYLHWIVYLPFAVFCATAVSGAVLAGIIELRAAKTPPAPPATAKIYYFSPAKTPLRSTTGVKRPALRLVSNGG